MWESTSAFKGKIKEGVDGRKGLIEKGTK